MAGGPPKTIGTILTVLGAMGLIAGLVAMTYGAFALGSESAKTTPNRDREGAGEIFLVGAATASVGFATLLVGIPTLVWDTQRVRDVDSGRSLTRRGGALKAWGLAFLIISPIAILVALFGGMSAETVAEEEERALVPNQDRAELAGSFMQAFLALASAGLLMAMAGVPLLIAGGARARRLDTVAVAPTHPRRGAAATGLTFVIASALGVLILFTLFSPGGILGVSTTPGSAPSGTPEEQWFGGHLSGASVPLVGGVGAGQQVAVHAVSTPFQQGVVEAWLEWSSSSLSPPQLTLLVEVFDGGENEWREIARAQGPSPLRATSSMTDVGSGVRVSIRFAEGSAGDTDYELSVSVTN